jgi:naphthalene 1,2-dioxygenase system ferredoxin subunit
MLPAEEMPESGRWWELASDSALAEAPMLGGRCDGHPIAVFRVGDELHATDGLCSHAFVPLEDGFLDGFEIECPVHQARFDVRTGACTQFPAKRPLRTFRVRVHEGRIEVWIPEGLPLAKGVRPVAR